LDDYIKIVEMARQGLSKSAIAQRLGIERHTVQKYLKEEVDPPQSQHRKGGSKLLSRFEERLQRRLAEGCTNAVVLLREIEKDGYKGSYTTLKDFVRPLREAERFRAELRWESPPGKYGQVDWGECVAQLPDGSRVKFYAFVFTLAYSRAMYVTWTNRMDMATFLRCHIEAFSYLGGVPEYLVYDRLKTAVSDDDHGKAIFNPAFLDFANYYGFTPRACPPNWPRGKGKVESGVRYVKLNFWLGLTLIGGLDDLNRQNRDWLDGIANTRTHGTTGRVPFEMLKEENLKPIAGIQPYPVNPAVIRIVSHDCLVSYGGCRYSVPAEWAGKTVCVRAVSSERIVVSAGDKVITEQPIEPVLKRTLITDAHYSSLRGRPRLKPVRVIPRLEMPANEVERRSLSEYAAITEVMP
jgi:transposase